MGQLPKKKCDIKLVAKAMWQLNRRFECATHPLVVCVAAQNVYLCVTPHGSIVVCDGYDDADSRFEQFWHDYEVPTYDEIAAAIQY